MDQPAYNALFFDLDGTLLPMDIHEFLTSYFTLLGKCAASAGFDAETFGAAVKTSVFSMGDHEPGVLNCDAFWGRMREHLGDDVNRAYGFFEGFYAKEFGTLGDAVVPNPAAAQAINTLRDKGYLLFLTTMPMFPLPAVEWRLRWAGVDPAAFSRITCYDNSTSIKPRLAYFEENLAMIDASAENVLMVGNNTKEDLACMDTSMDAYLVTDNLLNPNEFDVESVKHGSLADFADFAAALPVCAHPATVIAEGPHA